MSINYDYLEAKQKRITTMWIAIIILIIISVIISIMAFFPKYRVWSQEMEGRAEFAKAEQNRRIRIEEARANLEAEKLNAAAEIERAKGASEAIKIENGSLSEKYIQYLWVRQQNQLNDKTVIYIPTEANLPILEAGKNK
jgi:predicted Holliday junction resolvase-like endonuclease